MFIKKAHFYSGGVFLRRRHISTAEAHFYGGGIFLRRGCISTVKAHFYGGGVSLRRKCVSMKEVNLKAIGYHLYEKEEPTHGADEFLCRNCVILKCEALAPVGQHINLIIQLEALHCGICDLSSLWYLRLYVTSNSAVRVAKYSPTTI